MVDNFADALTHLITSPPVQFVAGSALAGVVWAMSGRVDAVLADNTKVEVAVWLLEREKKAEGLNAKAHNWPSTFASIFDTIFGERHLTLRCFRRSCLVSACGVVLMFLLWGVLHPDKFIAYFRSNPYPLIEYIPKFLFVSVLPDYISLLKSRFFIRFMGKANSLTIALLILLDFGVTLAIAVGTFLLYDYAFISAERRKDDLQLLHEGPTLDSRPGMAPLSAVLYPAFFTTIWVTLYGMSGLALKLERRMGRGLGWFNRRFDIEKKPVQSIGLVAGLLVALAYWTVVIVARA